jgi:PAS domain-containing protein
MNASALPSVYETDLLANVFDALPLPALVVDAEARIIDFNFTATRMLEQVPFAALRPGVGEALHCIHSTESLGGCGHSEACADCVIRNSVRDVFNHGKPSRKVARIALTRDGLQTRVDFLITVAQVPGESEPLALLILDDAAELSALLTPASSSPGSRDRGTAPGRKTGSS